jgi:hypothetical protein
MPIGVRKACRRCSARTTARPSGARTPAGRRLESSSPRARASWPAPTALPADHTGIDAQAQLRLLGLMHGHFDQPVSDAPSADYAAEQEARVNMGIGIVVPAPRIAEILALPEVEAAEVAYEERVRGE